MLLAAAPGAVGARAAPHGPRRGAQEGDQVLENVPGQGTVLTLYTTKGHNELPGFRVKYGLSCVIGPLGRLGAAATLGQHCPQMTKRCCSVQGHYLDVNCYLYLHLMFWQSLQGRAKNLLLSSVTHVLSGLMAWPCISMSCP